MDNVLPFRHRSQARADQAAYLLAARRAQGLEFVRITPPHQDLANYAFRQQRYARRRCIVC